MNDQYKLNRLVKFINNKNVLFFTKTKETELKEAKVNGKQEK